MTLQATVHTQIHNNPIYKCCMHIPVERLHDIKTEINIFVVVFSIPLRGTVEEVSLAAADVLQITAVAFELPPSSWCGTLKRLGTRPRWSLLPSAPGAGVQLEEYDSRLPVPIDRLGRRRPPTRGVTGERLPPAGHAAQSAARGRAAGN